MSSFVFVLKPDPRQTRDPQGSYDRRSRFGTTLRFRFPVIRVWEDVDAEDLLRSGPDALLALLPYAAGASREGVNQAMDRLSRVEPLARRAELQAALAVVAEDVFPGANLIGRIPEEVLTMSRTLQQLREMARSKGLAEGLAEGRVQGLAPFAALIEKRLGEATPRKLLERLSAAEAETLDRIVARLATAPADVDAAALAAEIDALLPPV